MDSEQYVQAKPLLTHHLADDQIRKYAYVLVKRLVIEAIFVYTVIGCLDLSSDSKCQYQVVELQACGNDQIILSSLTRCALRGSGRCLLR